jgi:hypothetical protein
MLSPMLSIWPLVSKELIPRLILVRSNVSIPTPALHGAPRYSCQELTSIVFGPMMSTAGTDEKVHNLYKRLGSFSPVSGMNTNLKAINAFCPSDDERQRRSCTPGAIAFEWDTSCQEQESDQSCTTNATNRINPESDKSYVNIQFCEEFFKLPTLEEVVQQGKSALKEKKYNLNTYWDNKGRLLQFTRSLSWLTNRRDPFSPPVRKRLD